MDFQAFKSWDEAMEAIQARKKECDAKIFGFQEALEKGDCFATDPGLGFLIFGEILEEPEDGYAFGKCYSVVVPDGELGDSHISVLVPITREEFELARSRGWAKSADIVVAALGRCHVAEAKASSRN